MLGVPSYAEAVPRVQKGPADTLQHPPGLTFLFKIQECALAAAALAAAMVAVLFQLAHDGFRVDALTTVVVGQSGLDGLLSQNRAVDLDGRQTFQSLDNGLVGQLQSLVNGLALDEVGGHAAGCDRSAAAEGEELDVNDDVVLDFEVHPHDVAALGVADFTHAVCVGDLTHVVRMCKMLHDLCAIHTCHFSFLPSG